MAPTPDREAFLRRLEQQQQQQAKERTIEETEVDQKEEILTKATGNLVNDDCHEEKITATIVKQDGQEEHEEEEGTIAVEKSVSEVNEKHVIEYLSDQCCLPVSFLQDIDGSTLAILRQVTPRKPVKKTMNTTIMTPSSIVRPESAPEECEGLKPDPSVAIEENESFAVETETRIISQPASKSPQTEEINEISFVEATKNSKETNETILQSASPNINDDISPLRTISGITFQGSQTSNNDKPDNITSNSKAINTINPIPPEFSNALGNSEGQKKLLEILENQHEVLRVTRNQVEHLEKQVQHLQTLLLQTPTGAPTLTARLPDPSPHSTNNHNTDQGMQKDSIWDQLQTKYMETREQVKKKRIIRAINHAIEEGRRQNILANLDFQLYGKMLLFAVMFGGKNAPTNRSSNPIVYFLDKYRMEVLVLLATFVYLMQIGIIGFFYRFLTKDLPRLEAEDMMEDERLLNPHLQDGDEEHKEENRNEAMEHAGVPPGPPRDQAPMDGILENDPAVPNQNANIDQENGHGADGAKAGLWQYLTDGGIDNNGGILHDAKYLVGSFLLSLIPTWKPVRLEEETDAVERNQQQQEQHGPLEGDDDELVERVQ